MVGRVPERVPVTLVVLYVINHCCLPMAVHEVDAQRMRRQEHPPIASPSLVVIQPEPLGMAAGEVVGMGRLVGAAIALSGRYQIPASLMLASVGGLMWHAFLSVLQDPIVQQSSTGRCAESLRPSFFRL